MCRPNEQADNLEHFVRQMAFTSCKPLVRVRYLREAYIGLAPRTGTGDLRYAPPVQADVSARTSCTTAGGWMPVSVGGVILEIKFTGAARVGRASRLRVRSSTGVVLQVRASRRTDAARQVPGEERATGRRLTARSRCRAGRMNGAAGLAGAARPGAAAGRWRACSCRCCWRSFSASCSPAPTAGRTRAVVLAVVHAVARHHGRRHHGPHAGDWRQHRHRLRPARRPGTRAVPQRAQGHAGHGVRADGHCHRRVDRNATLRDRHHRHDGDARAGLVSRNPCRSAPSNGSTGT